MYIKMLYDKNGYEHIIKYNSDTNDIYKILILDFLNQRVCINNNPSIIKYNVKTKKLMTINYGNEKDNLPLKIITNQIEDLYFLISFLNN